MDPVGRANHQAIPSTPPSRGGSPVVSTGGRHGDKVGHKGDSLSLGTPGRGVAVEVATQFLWFKDKQTFSLAPNAEGNLVFSHFNGKDELQSRKVVGGSDGPVTMSLDVQAGVPPFALQTLRIDISLDEGVARVRVTDQKTGRLLKEASNQS